jgi:hypothetical protein
MKRLVAAFGLLALVACAQEKQQVDSNQTPSEPEGTIVGFVTSLGTGAPLAGVTVTVPAPGGVRTATTDASGAYSLSGLPAGASYLARFSLASYVPGLGIAFIPNTAGDFPSNGIAQLNEALAQANATLNGHVYARDGAAAAGVDLTVDLRDQGFDLIATAATNASGAYSLTGLPGAPTGLGVEVVAQPWDADGDALVDYDAVTKVAYTYPGAASLLDFDLRSASADLLLLTSTLESGSIVPAAQIQLTFNRSLDLAFTSASLYDSTAGRYVAITWSLDTSSKILTIVPAGTTTLAAYHTYSLGVDAVASNGSSLNVSRTFLADSPATLLPLVSGLTVSPTNADYNTATFTLSWSASAGASSYQVWLHDSSTNPDWLLAKTVGTTPAPTTSVTLPGSFDYYTADGIQTPFAFGVGVSFAVVAANAAGDAPSPTTATPVSRTDTVAPTVLSAVQSSSADNSAGSLPKVVTLTLSFSEYMDTTVLPTITLTGAGVTSTFAWNANRTLGVITITIPAGVDATGTYTVGGAKDTSANTMATRTGTLTSPIQLVVNGDFETGSLSGWTTTATGTSTTPVTTSALYATGLWSAHLGNTGTTAQYGISAVYQVITLPTGYSSIVANARYRPYSDYPYAGWDTSSCTIQNSAGTATLATIFTTYSNSTLFLYSPNVSITGLAGQTVRVHCQTNQVGSDITGMYLDDVSIIATP